MSEGELEEAQESDEEQSAESSEVSSNSSRGYKKKKPGTRHEDTKVKATEMGAGITMLKGHPVSQIMLGPDSVGPTRAGSTILMDTILPRSSAMTSSSRLMKGILNVIKSQSDLVGSNGCQHR